MTGSFSKSTGSSGDTVAFRKAADYCAFQERCISEVQQKLHIWEMDKATTDSIIRRLIEEDFINQQRYASAFVRGKFHNLQWGRIKIQLELKRKNIGGNLISIAIKEIDEMEYLKCIQMLIEKKIKTLGSNTLENRYKAMRFVAGKGFESELIRQIINEERAFI